jgi:hypothetical protein
MTATTMPPMPASFARAAAALLTAASLLGFSAPAAAHHSSAMFDATVETPLVGTVRTFKWSNPHAWIELDVEAEDGAATMWAIESQPPNMLMRRGWTRTSLRTGDQVTIVINPLKDGQPGGSLVSVTLPDGTELRD